MSVRGSERSVRGSGGGGSYDAAAEDWGAGGFDPRSSSEEEAEEAEAEGEPRSKTAPPQRRNSRDEELPVLS